MKIMKKVKIIITISNIFEDWAPVNLQFIC